MLIKHFDYIIHVYNFWHNDQVCYEQIRDALDTLQGDRRPTLLFFEALCSDVFYL